MKYNIRVRPFKIKDIILYYDSIREINISSD